jgi:hypothetical protein
MAGKSRPSDDDYATAISLGLLGLTAHQNLDEVMDRLVSLCPRFLNLPTLDH